MRETDRYNERIGTGEVKREVILMLKDMNSKLQVHYCVLVSLKLLTEVKLIVFISIVVCRSRTLIGVVFWKCSEMFLEPCGTSCIVKPILHDKERYDVDGAVEFLTLFSILLSFLVQYMFFQSFCVGCERLDLLS